MKKFLFQIFLFIFLVGAIIWMFLVISTTLFPTPNPVSQLVTSLLNLPSDFVAKPVIVKNEGTLDDFLFGSGFYNFYGFATIIVITGLFTITKGRNLIEKYMLLQAYALPKQRDYWGKIIDHTTHKPVPFAAIQIYKLDNKGNKIFTGQTVADTDGRYRMYIMKSDDEYFIEVRASGYEAYKEKVRTTLIDGENIIRTNIFLQKESSEFKINPVRKFYLDHRAQILRLLTAFIFAMSILTCLHGLYGLIFHFNMVSVGNFIFYGFAAPWNIYVIWERNRFNPGRVLESVSRKPIANVTVHVFINTSKIISVLSDAQGVVKLNVEAGDYKIKLFKTGFILEDNVASTLNVLVNNEGFLKEDIYLIALKDPNSQAQDLNLLNPFG